MKFFTPEWYNDTIISDMYIPLRKTQKAAEFSEKFYQKLLGIELKAYLRHTKRAAKYTRESFDVNTATAQFHKNCEENLAFIKANLPEDILKDIKDLRVLALGSAEYDIAARIERFCGKVYRRCQEVESQYEAELEAVADLIGWETVNSIELLLSSPVESVREEQNNIIITTSKEVVGVSYEVKLLNAKAVSLPKTLTDAYIVRAELIREGEQLAFGLLCIDQESNVITADLQMSDIVISTV